MFRFIFLFWLFWENGVQWVREEVGFQLGDDCKGLGKRFGEFGWYWWEWTWDVGCGYLYKIIS